MQMTITLPTGPDGLLGRLCPVETCRPRYFKVPVGATSSQSSNDPPADDAQSLILAEEDPKQSARWCPYCGHQDDPQAFTTPEQLAYAKSVALRQFTSMLQRQLKQLERQPDPHTLLSIGVEVQLGDLPAIAEFAEEHLKRIVTCPHCEQQYAIYGLSHVCPHCGQDTLLWHLDQDADVIAATLQLADQASLPAAAHRIIDNALEDVISLWEGYLKALYIYGIRHTKTSEEVDKLERTIKTTFQRIDGAASRYEDDLHISLLASLDPQHIALFRASFEKRHIITHNLGIADERYQEHTGGAQAGQEVDITPGEVNAALTIVHTILRYAHQQVVTLIGVPATGASESLLVNVTAATDSTPDSTQIPT